MRNTKKLKTFAAPVYGHVYIISFMVIIGSQNKKRTDFFYDFTLV